MPGRGYQRLYEPTHPLTDTSGYVSEHRMVVYARYGVNLPNCEICGKSSSWATSHIDHRDNDPKNNHPDNLRPLCPGCNTWRDMPPLHTFDRCHAITYDGRTATAQEWARDPRVEVAGRTIVLRLAAGMSAHDALFAPKITHNGKPKVDNRARKTTCAAERKNAVNITIDGELKTAMEWSRDSRCEVSDATLRNRIKAGWKHDTKILKLAEGYSNTGKAPEGNSRRTRAQYVAKLKELKHGTVSP
jgi:HNH endonuclease.